MNGNTFIASSPKWWIIGIAPTYAVEIQQSCEIFSLGPRAVMWEKAQNEPSGKLVCRGPIHLCWPPAAQNAQARYPRSQCREDRMRRKQCIYSGMAEEDLPDWFRKREPVDQEVR